MKKTLTLTALLVSSIAHVALGGVPFQQLTRAEKMQAVHIPGVEESQKRWMEDAVTREISVMLKAWTKAQELPIEEALGLLGKDGEAMKELLLNFRAAPTQEAQETIIRERLRNLTRNWELKKTRIVVEWVRTLVEHAVNVREGIGKEQNRDLYQFQKLLMHLEVWRFSPGSSSRALARGRGDPGL